MIALVLVLELRRGIDHHRLAPHREPVRRSDGGDLPLDLRLVLVLVLALGLLLHHQAGQDRAVRLQRALHQHPIARLEIGDRRHAGQLGGRVGDDLQPGDGEPPSLGGDRVDHAAQEHLGGAGRHQELDLARQHLAVRLQLAFHPHDVAYVKTGEREVRAVVLDLRVGVGVHLEAGDGDAGGPDGRDRADQGDPVPLHPAHFAAVLGDPHGDLQRLLVDQPGDSDADVEPVAVEAQRGLARSQAAEAEPPRGVGRGGLRRSGDRDLHRRTAGRRQRGRVHHSFQPRAGRGRAAARQSESEGKDLPTMYPHEVLLCCRARHTTLRQSEAGRPSPGLATTTPQPGAQ